MKTGGTCIVVCGAVVVALLMISSATAVTTISAQTMVTQKSKNETYVNPKIHLTTANLPLLKKSVNYIDNANVKKVVQQIITTIEQKGKVNSYDIQKIIKDLDMSFSTVTSGIVHGSGPGGARIPLAFKFVGPLYVLYFNLFPRPLAHWSATIHEEDKINIYVNSDHYTTPHEGIAVGWLIGQANLIEHLDPGADFWTSFDINGIGLLIFVI